MCPTCGEHRKRHRRRCIIENGKKNLTQSLRIVRVDPNNQLSQISVYRTLKDAIQFLDFEPGSRIVEAELTERLGLSRTPIREAMIRLSDEQLIDRYPQRGTYVSKIDVSLAKEMAYLRHIVETDVIMHLCKKKVDLADAVAQSLFAMNQALERDDIREYLVQNDSFHLSIFCAGGHGATWDVISNTLTHYIRYLMLDMTVPASLPRSFQEHQQMIELIRNGETRRLEQLLISHHDSNALKDEDKIRARYSSYLK